MNKEEFLQSGLLEQYLMGLTSPEEALLVEEMIQKHPEVKKHIQDLQAEIDDYVDKTIPRPYKSSVASSFKHHFSYFAVICCLGLFAFWISRQYHNKRNETLQLRSILASVESTCADAKNKSKHHQVFVKDPKTQFIHLQNNATDQKACVHVFWNREKSEAYLQIMKLDRPPSDKQYQLWGEINGKMTSINVLDCIYYEWIPINIPTDAESINLTLEPKGGSLQPNIDYIVASGHW